MKNICVLVTIVLFSFISYAQKTSTDEYVEGMLSRNISEQQQIFFQRYSFLYLSIKEKENIDTKGARTLQVVKNEIKDTIKPFFNTITVNATTMEQPMAYLKNNIHVWPFLNTLENSNTVQNAVEGKVEYNITDFPYRPYIKINSTITSVTGESGNNLLINGKDTVVNYWSQVRAGQYSKDAVFSYDNTEKPEKITVNGKVTVKVPTKFLITTFTPAEVGKSKEFQQYTFTLDECASGKVILSSTGYKVKSRIDIYALGPGDIEYRQDYKRCAEQLSFTDAVVYNLVNSHNTMVSKDSLIALYFNEYTNYLKQGPVKLMTVYSACYKGNIEKVYIVTPIEYFTTTETFSITTE